MTRPLNKRNSDLSWARRLAEAIILQAIEDVCYGETEIDSMEFFRGDGFTDCADVIGMSLYERQKVLHLAEKASKNSIQPLKSKTSSNLERKFVFFPQHPRLQM